MSVAQNGNGCEEIAGRWQNNSLCPKQIRLLGVINVKIQTERHCPVKHFAFLKNVCYQYYNFVLWVTYCFLTSCWLAHNQLSWSVLFLPFNLIGQLCLCGPGYTAFQRIYGMCSATFRFLFGKKDKLCLNQISIYNFDWTKTKITRVLWNAFKLPFCTPSRDIFQLFSTAIDNNYI